MFSFIMFFMLCVVGVATAHEAVRYREEEIFRGFAPDKPKLYLVPPCTLEVTATLAMLKEEENRAWLARIDEQVKINEDTRRALRNLYRKARKFDKWVDRKMGQYEAEFAEAFFAATESYKAELNAHADALIALRPQLETVEGMFAAWTKANQLRQIAWAA